MLREVWRLQRDQFWVPDMSGVDWEAMYRRYRPLLDLVSTRAELSDLIWELHGELGTSHAYEMGGDHRKPPAMALGKLGAELAPDCQWNRLRDPRDRERRSMGDRCRLAAERGRGRCANRRTHRRCQWPVRFARQAATGAPGPPGRHESRADAGVHRRHRAVGDRPAPGRRSAGVRYRWWVESAAAGAGCTSVQAGASATFTCLTCSRQASPSSTATSRTKCDRAALIVDVRFNRGGHVSQLLLEKIARRRIGYDLQRWGLPTPYPTESPAGPLIALTNEHAGSDGDIFSHCFKLMKLRSAGGQADLGRCNRDMAAPQGSSTAPRRRSRSSRSGSRMWAGRSKITVPIRMRKSTTRRKTPPLAAMRNSSGHWRLRSIWQRRRSRDLRRSARGRASRAVRCRRESEGEQDRSDEARLGQRVHFNPLPGLPEPDTDGGRNATVSCDT